MSEFWLWFWRPIAESLGTLAMLGAAVLFFVTCLLLMIDPWKRIAELSAELAALRQQVAELQAERDDFHMKYRMKCDEQTKALVIRAEAAESRISELTMHQSLQDSTTAAVMEQAEKAKRERDALRKDAEVGKLVRAKLVSGNIIKMERCMILAAEVDSIDAPMQAKEK